LKEVNQILLDLKRKIYKPVYFLSGEEPYYIDQVSDYIEANVLDESEKEFNQTVIYGKDTDVSGILALAKQFPMMSEHTVVIVKEAQAVKDLGKNTSSEEPGDKSSAASSAQQLVAYLNNPQPTTILVFCYKYKTIDKRSTIAKALQKHAVFLETKKLYDSQLPEWIGNLVKERGYTIGPKATMLLGEFLGNDLARISNEVDKLLISLPAGSEITADKVQDNIGISKEYNVFELQDALGKKDILKANRIIAYFSSNEKDNPMVLVMSNLFNYFTKVLRYHFLQDKSKFAAAQGLGVNPFFVESYAKAAQNYNTGKLKLIFSALKEYDLKSKGVDNPSTSHGELLKELIYKILH
jgi:DNA polymerase III subunit delta